MDSELVSLAAITDAPGVNLYDVLGGMDACRGLSVAFYAHVEHDPILRPLYPPTLKGCPIEALADFLVQFLGGPCVYAPRRWYLSLREAHLRFKIGQQERDAWLNNMFRALDDVNIEEPARSALRWYFEQVSAYLINHHQAEANEPALSSKHPVESQQEPPADNIHQDIAQRWHTQRTLEEIVAAVRKGNADHALKLLESTSLQTYFDRDYAAFLSLLAIFSGSDHPVLLHYVSQKLLNNPELVQQRYPYGRTLLHEVAGNGSLAIMELLLRLGADPNTVDQAERTPLYYVGNECNRESGSDIVRMLVQAGADVDAQENLKHCTALHMAARRGNIRVAEALLDCKANIEARDKLGDTPLRRAVNCGKTEIAAFLLSRGANVHSKGNKGLTSWQVARGAAMKKILQTYSE
jgi:ankyrin repeat protein/truncated hemoglobin YjbI